MREAGTPSRGDQPAGVRPDDVAEVDRAVAPTGGSLTHTAGATSSGTQQSPEGTEVTQRLWAKTLPLPLPSQKMSGSLPLMTLAFTTFPLGVDPAELGGVDDDYPTVKRRGTGWRVPGYDVAGD